ncbi:uncharacterized protein LOC103317320 [Nasonia vitripennis]|uniref:Uncharacterized protein n=1 Tax=Nasonia vitripennis TaxID=7425 RepID=A0A7M7Q321_NASVI|nr:uncharacterized protein LOC103317320 [Nasonia vitripennis]
MNDVSLFLPLFHNERVNYHESQKAILNSNSNVDLNMSFTEIVVDESVPSDANIPIIDVQAPINTDDISMSEEIESSTQNSTSIAEVENEISTDEISTSKETESSTHKNVADDFKFVENSWYFSLKDTIEGRIILGMYKHSKILLQSRLKVYVIQKLIVENPVTYKISNSRFEEVTNQIVQLFPTTTATYWYCKSHANAHGQHMSASGCLINSYKVYRKNLVLAGIIEVQSASANTSSSIVTAEVNENSELDLSPLTNSNRSEYSILTITDTWVKSFEKRQQILVVKKNKKVTIRYDSYLNTFVCLNSSFGLELLQTDSYSIIQGLLETNATSKTIADNFRSIFDTRWTILTPLLCKFGDVSQISCIKDFRRTHKEYIAQIPKPILALLYAVYFLTKANSVTTKERGTYTFSRDECVENFIKVVENESLVETYISKLKRKLNDLGLAVAPYVIFCGRLDNITKAFVVFDTIRYEIKDPLKAVEACLQISIALHSWAVNCSTVWLYLLEHIYYIRPNISCAFPPAKTAKTVSAFINKIDPSFTTAEESATTS